MAGRRTGAWNRKRRKRSGQRVPNKPSVVIAPPDDLCHPDAPGGKSNIPRRRLVEKQKPKPVANPFQTTPRGTGWSGAT
eukprot:8427702-Alexandrium_andersonii.AAC.1